MDLSSINSKMMVVTCSSSIVERVGNGGGKAILQSKLILECGPVCASAAGILVILQIHYPVKLSHCLANLSHRFFVVRFGILLMLASLDHGVGGNRIRFATENELGIHFSLFELRLYESRPEEFEEERIQTVALVLAQNRLLIRLNGRQRIHLIALVMVKMCFCTGRSTSTLATCHFAPLVCTVCLDCLASVAVPTVSRSRTSLMQDLA
mmetsp:Transcript_22942/g.41642  ORF Transcript_22942/g.41642 Transcript_22942/m.41642 type:complete len:209 (+) Transcript_22942:379-1005(+)